MLDSCCPRTLRKADAESGLGELVSSAGLHSLPSYSWQIGACLRDHVPMAGFLCWQSHDWDQRNLVPSPRNHASYHACLALQDAQIWGSGIKDLSHKIILTSAMILVTDFSPVHLDNSKFAFCLLVCMKWAEAFIVQLAPFFALCRAPKTEKAQSPVNVASPENCRETWTTSACAVLVQWMTCMLLVTNLVDYNLQFLGVVCIFIYCLTYSNFTV